METTNLGLYNSGVLADVDKAKFEYDMRRLCELFSFPKAWVSGFGGYWIYITQHINNMYIDDIANEVKLKIKLVSSEVSGFARQLNVLFTVH